MAWGQDYSGTYYIGSKATKQNNTANSYIYNSEELANNYYLCPTEGWYFYNGDNNTSNGWTETDNGKPFLTTYKFLEDGEYDASKAVWVIEKKTNTDFYYIKQKKTTANEKYRYLVSNKQISGAGVRRMRVHLEEVADATALNNLGDLALFEITTVPENLASNCLYITPHSPNGRNGSELYLVVNDGNYNNLKAGVTKNDGPNDTYTQGTIGVYSTETNGYWTLEVPRPVISFNASNQVEITDPTGFASAIYFTTNGDDPTVDPSNLYSAAFDPDDNVTTIKAIAIVDGQKSGVTTFTPPFLLGSTHKYAIQSNDCLFYYLIPNLQTTENEYPKNVSTLNVPCNTMAWSFENAVDNDGQYYYIHNSQGGYLYYPTTDNTDNYIFLQQDKDTNDDGYKFSITSHASGGFNLIPKNQTIPVNKTSVGSSDGEKLRAVKLAGAINNASSRWNIIPYNNTTGIPQWTDKPFDESTNSVSHFYQITNVNQSTKPLILNNSGFIKSETLPETGYDSRKSMWVIKNVGQDTDGLLDYYTFQNAYTGDLLYYNGSGREIVANASPGVLQTGMPTAEGANVTWAHFVIVQTVSGYNIIPRVLVDNTKAITRNSTHEAFNCINRASGNDWTGTYYDNDNGSRWTFTKVDNVKCMEPVFTEEANGDITITTVTNAAKIRYSVDGADPTESSAEYTTKENTSVQKVIKAIAIIGDDINTASSIVALLNKPDVTLAGGPYTYKAADWEPSVTLSVGTTQTTTGFSTTYAYNTNAGTANVTITDNEASDAWYIWNVPVTEFTIDKAPLTIKANDKTIGYGDEPDNAGVTYSGFVGSPAETEDVLGGTLSYSYTTSGDDPHPYTPYDAQYGNQGTYVITPSGLTSTNYDITFSTGVLTVAKKSIGDGALAEGFTLSFDEDGNVILNFGTHTLNKDVDYTIGNEVVGTKYSTRTLFGAGNYDGSVDIRNAIVHFTTDANQTEWSATFVAESSGGTDIGHALPENIAAYIISDIEGTWAIPEPLEYIPAGVPVLLVTHEAKNGFLVKDANNVTAISEGQIAYNKLKKVTTESAHFNTRQIYVLYNNEFVLNKEGNLENGKVYMENPNYNTSSPFPAPARLTIIWGNETNIEDIQTNGAMEVGNERWYTIDGRRLNGKPNAKGLYILNGKKKVVK